MFKRISRKFEKHIEIKNLKKINLETDDYLYHAGTLKKKIIAIML